MDAERVWEAALKEARVYCRGVLGTADIDDVAIEATERALRYGYDPSRSSLDTFLARIARSVAGEMARRRTRERRRLEAAYEWGRERGAFEADREVDDADNC